MMIKIVMFDVGGVLVDYDQTWHNKELAEISGMSREYVDKVIDKYMTGIEIGKVRINEFESAVAHELGIRKSQLRWADFFAAHSRLNEDVYELLKEIHEEMSTAIFSNIDKARYKIVRQILPFTYIDHAFTSCYLGLRKPDPKAYMAIAKRLNLKPNEIVFIDNDMQNVLGARTAGLNAIRFKSRRELDKSLSKFMGYA